MNELKDVLIVTVDMRIRPDTMRKIKEDIREQIKSGVVVLPSVYHPKIINCPENIEIRIESAAEPE